MLICRSSTNKESGLILSIEEAHISFNKQTDNIFWHKERHNDYAAFFAVERQFGVVSVIKFKVLVYLQISAQSYLWTELSCKIDIHARPPWSLKCVCCFFPLLTHCSRIWNNWCEELSVKSFHYFTFFFFFLNGNWSTAVLHMLWHLNNKLTTLLSHILRCFFSTFFSFNLQYYFSFLRNINHYEAIISWKAFIMNLQYHVPLYPIVWLFII